MSSDYLCYKLSKELHELGVEFDSGTIDQRMVTELGIGIYRRGVLESTGVCITPSTAQLIDKLRDIAYFCLDFSEDDNEYAAGTIATHCDNKCATTALGQALIELVKGEKNGKTNNDENR